MVLWGSGDAGNIDVNAEFVRINGLDFDPFTGIGATVQETGSGKGGNINLKTMNLDILNGGTIAVDTFGIGDGGDIFIDAESVRIDSPDSAMFTGIGGDSLREESGKGGNINVITKRLEIMNGGLIQTSTVSISDAGNIKVIADNIVVDGHHSNSPLTGISANTEGQGNGGNINVENVAELTLARGASISVVSEGVGDAGSITVNVESSALVREGSSITAEAAIDGGGININSGNELLVASGSQIVANAGNNGGNIELLAPSIIRITNSLVSAEAGNNGGNITIDPVHTILESSRLIADAQKGRGGTISITTEALVRSADTVISAKSAEGIQGTVEISAPDVDISGSLAVLSESFITRDLQLQERCAVKIAGDFSSFIIVGRGGTRIRPNDFVPGFILEEE